MWIDSHAHVTAPEFDADRGAVLARARTVGVEAILAVGAGWGLEGNEAAVALAAETSGAAAGTLPAPRSPATEPAPAAEARAAPADARAPASAPDLPHPEVYAAVGVHPHDARLLDDPARRRIEAWLSRPGVVAVGECGLDYHYMHSPREVQRAVFAEHLAWARARDLPLSIHVRSEGPEAWEEMLDIWRAEGGGRLTGVLHCYTGSLDFARRALDAGLDVSFSGILTFRNAAELRTVAAALPLGRLLVETDCPLLAPVPHRGRRNEPAHVAVVGAALAAARGIAPAEAARATAANARRLFRLPAPAAGSVRP